MVVAPADPAAAPVLFWVTARQPSASALRLPQEQKALPRSGLAGALVAPAEPALELRWLAACQPSAP
ncbi:MAG TPA: hypothetical protein VKT26_03885, partial [Acetobacteraceae bacterium]|nr:hypothetical protein [Acetobacteraceae bacterium]